MKSVMISILLALIGIPGAFVVVGASEAYQNWGWVLSIPVILGVILWEEMEHKNNEQY